MPAVNWLAVIVAAIAMFGLGAVWYSPMLFVKQWAKAAGVNREGSPGGNFIFVMGGSFVLTLLMAANLGFFVAGVPDLGAVIGYSIAAGLGWATFSLWIISLFEQRPFSYILINGGYLTIGFTIMGLILGLWR
jgi:hypothetical protein